MRVLSIESSCDETSVAVVEKKNISISVLSHTTATSLDIHATTGGIIPENAARMQVEYILPTLTQTLIKSRNEKLPAKKSDQWTLSRKILIEDIDVIAVTFGPGLIGSLLVGVEAAKTLSFIFNKPLIPVNHLLAHIYANFIGQNSKLPDTNSPFIGLVVSGGHTDLLLFRSHKDYSWLGGTRDDAAGEAFDKVGRVLGLPYPAGPEIERRASLIRNPTIKFKSPLINEDNYDFSFSGLKTEAMRTIQANPNHTEDFINSICHATQKAIIDVLIKKTIKAATENNCTTILVGGGVSANQTFKDKLTKESSLSGITTHFPERIYSTDNGAMIGAYALINPVPVEWESVSANPELYFA